MMKEEWRDIRGYEGIYQVSSLGRVRSLPRVDYIMNIARRNRGPSCEAWQRKGKILKPIRARNFHSDYVHLYPANGVRVSVTIKRLVAEAFLPDFTYTTTTNSIRLKDDAKGCAASNLYIVKSL